MKWALPCYADVSEIFVLLKYKQRELQMICDYMKYWSHPDEDPLPSL